MNRFNIIAFGAAITVGAAIGSIVPASAGIFSDAVKTVNNKVHPKQKAPGMYEVIGNKDYMGCLKLMQSASEGGGMWGPKKYYGSEQKALYDKGRRQCNRQYYPNRAGVDY